jgi:hypothetical protein
MKRITLFERCTKPNAPYFRYPDEIYNFIKNERYKTVINEIRNEPDKKKRSDLKVKNLVAVCWSGEFSKRANEALLKHSGLICIDFDHLDNLIEFRQRIESDQYTYISFLSPSGDGLKVIVKIPDSVETHLKSWQALKEYYGTDKIDEAAKDVSRVCFISSDPNIFINNEAKIFNELKDENELKPKQKEYKQEFYPSDRISESKEIYDRIVKWLDSKMTFSDGKKNDYLVNLSSACLRFGIPEFECETIINFNYSNKAPSSDIKRIVRDIYKNFASSACTAHFEKDGKPIYTKTKEIVTDKIFDIQLAEKDIIYIKQIEASMNEGFETGKAKGTTTYFRSFDKHWTWRKKNLNFIGGIGNIGKTTFFNNLAVLKAMKEDWKFAIFSPEQDPPDDFYNDLIHTYIGKSTEPYHANQMTKKEYEIGKEFISEHFYYIFPETASPTPEYINYCFEFAIKKHKIDCVMVDPFNQLDNDWKKYGRDDLYISEFLSKNKRFAQTNDIIYFITGHPKGNLEKLGGNYVAPTVYEYAGGAMWNNKCDDILCYHRPFAITEPGNTECIFISQKIKKRKLTGIPGAVKMNFDIYTNRFFELDGYNPFEKTEVNNSDLQSNINWYDKENKEFDSYIPDGIEADF